eukprot:8005043-Heterocapsa_arctica.AAC.1
MMCCQISNQRIRLRRGCSASPPAPTFHATSKSSIALKARQLPCEVRGSARFSPSGFAVVR